MQPFEMVNAWAAGPLIRPVGIQPLVAAFPVP